MKFFGTSISIIAIILISAFSVNAQSCSGSSLTSAGSASICTGDSVVLIAQPSTAGYSYRWRNGAALISGQSGSTLTVSPAGSGSYSVIITNTTLGCYDSLSIAITVNTLPVPTITPATNSVCAGSAISFTAGGGVGYAWSTGVLTALLTVSPAATTTYTVTVANAAGCRATASRTITVNALPVSVITPTTTVTICSGTPTSLTASGGTSYAWSNGGGNNATTNVSPTTTTNYCVTVTGSNTCTASACKTVNVNAKPTVNLSTSANTICNGGSTIVSANATAGSGSISTYTWNPALGNVGSAQVSPTSNTTYRVTVTNSNGCSASGSATVNVNSNTTNAALNGNGFQIFYGQEYFVMCASSPQVLTVLNTSTTWSANSSYVINWGDGSPNFIQNNAWGQNGTTTHTYAVGLWTLTLTVTANGCTATKIYKVFVGNTPQGGINSCGNNEICYPDSACFSIDRRGGNPNNNPPGTVYDIQFTDDTSYHEVYVEPNVPAQIKHKFPGSSCGQIFSLSQNTWGAIINISNPCGSSGIGISLTVFESESQAVNFIMPQIACAGSPVTIEDTTTTNLYNHNGSCGADIMAWRISPPVAPSSGSLGVVIYTPQFSLINGSPSLSVNFPVGTYTVTHYVYNQPCGVDSIVKQICVLPVPIASFTLSPTAGCAPLPVTAINTSNTIGGCLLATYNWTVSYVPSAPCGTTSSWNFTGGTNASSVNPSFSFNTAGTYTVTLTVTNQCGTNSVNHTVTVKRPPLVSINPVTNHCGSYNFAPTATVTNCGTQALTYAWSSVPTGFISTLASPSSFNFTATGTNTISLVATNECGTAMASTSFVISPIPTMVVPASFAVCPGVSVPPTSFSSTPLGATYAWINSNTAIGLGALGTGNVPTFTSTNTGSTAISGTITVTPMLNGCPGLPYTYTITVNPKPVLSVTSANLCVGIGGTLTASVSNGSASYVWNPGGANTGTINVPAINATYTVTASMAGTFCTSTGSGTVTVLPTPVADAGADVSYCSGSSAQIGAANQAGYSYSWSPPTGLSGATVSNPTVSVTTTGTTVVTSTYTLITSVGTCRDTDQVVVTVYPPATVNAGPSVAICAGSGSVTLAGTTGGVATSWTWSSNNGGTFSNAASLTSTFTPTGTSILTLTTNDPTGPCPAVLDTMVVAVLPTPVADAGADVSYCSGSSAQIGAANQAGYSYSWSPPTGLSGATVSNPTVSVTTTGTTVVTSTYTLITSVGTCRDTDQVVVTVYPPATVNAGPSVAICAGSGSVTLAGTTGGVATSWTWSSNNGGTFSNAASLTSTFIPTGTSILTLTTNDPTGPCPAVLDTMVVAVLPTPVADAGADVSYCSGSSAQIGAANQAGYSYSWSPPTGLSGATVSNPTVSVTTTGTTVVTSTYTLITSVGTCRDTDQVVVTVYPPATVNAGPSVAICAGSGSVTLAGNTGGVATSWTWSSNNGGTFSNAASLTSTFIPTGTSILTLTTNDPTGPCPAVLDTMVVAVLPTPVADAGADVSYCSGSSAQIGAANQAGYSYSWSPPTGLSGATVSNPTVSVTTTGTTVVTSTYTLITSVGTCRDTDQVVVTVYPPATVNAGPSVAICAGSGSVTLAGTTGGVATSWTWSSNNGGTFSNAASLTSTFIPTGTSILTLTTNDPTGPCPAVLDTMVVAVLPTPVADAGADVSYCSGSSAQIGAANQAGYSYSWSPPTGLSGATVSNPTVSVTTTGTTVVTSTYTLITSVGTCRDTDQVVVTVYPPATVNAGPSVAICAGSGSVTLAGTTGGVATSWTWSSNNGGTFSNAASLTSTFIPTGTSILTLTTNDPTGPCPAVLDTMVVAVLPTPVADAGADVSYCSGSSAQIGAANQAGYSYSWSPPTGLSGATVSNPTVSVTTTGTTVVTSTYTLITSVGTCRDTDQVVVTVYPPATVNAGPSVAICAGSGSVTLAGNTGGVATSWTWSSNNGGTFSNAASLTSTFTPTGTSILTLTTNDPIGPCPAVFDTMVVTVYPLPTVNAGPNITLCNQPVAQPLTGYSPTTGGTGVWSGSYVTSAGVFTPTGTPAGLGTFVLTYTFTENTHSCVSRDTITVTVVAPQIADAGTGFVRCVDGAPVTLNATPSGGTWSGPGVSGNTFTPSVAGVSNLFHVLTYTYGTGTCLSTDTIHAIVNPLPTVTVNSPATCYGVPAVLTASGTAGTTYSWSPSTGLSSPTGAIDTLRNPTVNTSITVTGTVTATGCTNTAVSVITVYPLPVVNAGPNITLCNQPVAQPLTGYSPTTGGTGVWSGSYVTSAGVFTPTGTPPGLGTFVLTYTFTENTHSCVSRDTITVTVVAPQIADAGTGFVRCVDGAPVTLNATPSGGTWSGPGVSGNTFTPSVAGVSNLFHVLTYTYGTGTCLSTDTIHAVVNPLPTVTVNSPATCYGVPAVLTASGTAGTTYSWSPSTGLSSPTGAIDTLRNPTVNTSITVTGTVTATGCTNTAVSVITVYPLPVVNAGPNITLCNQPTAETLAGYSPTTGGTGVWSGSYVTSAGVFTPTGTPPGLGTFVLTYTFTENTHSCVSRDTITVTVVAPQIADAGTGFVRCVDGAPVTLNATPSGGTWSGPGVSGNTFTPSVAGVSNLFHVLTYTYGTGTCLSTDTIHAIVNPLPTVTVNSPATCYGVPAVLTASGTAGTTYSWSPSTGLSSPTGAIDTLRNPTVNTSITVTGTVTATGCTNTAVSVITVYPLPVVNAGPNITLCNQPIAETLAGYSPTTGGTGVWSGSYVTSAGVFTPTGTPPGLGTFVLTYTFTENIHSCVSRDTITVTVVAPQIADAGTGFVRCVDGAPVTLNGTPANGTWSGPGVSGNTFTPSVAGVSNLFHVLTYTYGTGTCLSTDTIHAVVNPLPTVTVNSPATCYGVPAVLTASGTAGTTYSWSPSTGLSSPTGAIDTLRNPTVNTSITVTGTVTATGCTNTAVSVITVNPLPVVNAGPDTTLCNQPIPVTLVGSPSGGVWSLNNITSVGVYTPNGTGTFPVMYTYTDANGCINRDTAQIIVTNPAVVVAGPDSAVCINSGNIQLTGSPAGGAWNGGTPAITPSGLFTPSQDGTYNLVYTYGTGTCLKRDTMIMLVNPLPLITITPNPAVICFGDSINLTASAPGTNSFNWSPVAGLNTTAGATVNAKPLVTTGYTVTVVNTATGCQNTAVDTVHVKPLPTVTNNPLQDVVCSGHSTPLVTLTASLPSPSFTWWATSADGVIGFSTAPGTGNIPPQLVSISDTIPGHLVYHIIPSADGCTGDTTDYIFTVNPTPGIILPPDTTICNGANNAVVILRSNISTSVISWHAAYNQTLVSLSPDSGFGNIPQQVIHNSDVNPQVVTYHVIASVGGCDSTLDYRVTVNPSPTVAFSHPSDSICSGDWTVQNNLTTATPNASIVWTASIPTGISGASVSGTNTIPAEQLFNQTYVPLSIIYQAVATTSGSAACPGIVSYDSVTVKPRADIIASLQRDTVCSASPINIQFTSNVIGTTFSWTSTAPANITGNSNGPFGLVTSITDTLRNTDNIPLTVSYTIQTSAWNCPGDDTTLTIVVNPVPVVTFTPAGPQVICDSDATAAVNITSPTPGASITFNAIYSHADVSGVADSGGSTIPVQTLINHSDTTQEIIYSVTVGYLNCPGTGNSYIIRVRPTPHVTNTDTVQNLCSDDSTNIIRFTSNVYNTTYSWSTNGNDSLTGFILNGITDSIPSQVINNPTNQVHCFDYTVVPTFEGCAGVPLVFTICVAPRPVISIDTALSFQSICTGTTSTPVPAYSTIPGTIFTWVPMGATSSFVSGVLTSYTGDTLPSHMLNNNSTTGDTGYVYYTVSSFAGFCTGSNAIDTIQVRPNPAVDFIPSTLIGCSELHVSFYLDSLIRASSDTLVFTWGDGKPNDTLVRSPITPHWPARPHIFVNDSTGIKTYTISLLAHNDCGYDTATHTVTVLPDSIEAFMRIDTTTACEPYTATLYDYSTGSTSTFWCFNYNTLADTCYDATQQTTPGDSVIHTFYAGTYVVALHITDGCAQSTAFQTIHVNPSPVVDFTYNDNVCENVPVNFTSLSTAPAGSTLTAYLWHFGDGDTLVSINATHLYDSAATYNACLRVTESVNGCATENCHPVSILPSPKVDFSRYDTCVNTQPVQFINNTTFTDSSNPQAYYQWSFGDGNFSNQQSPANSFTTADTFTVSLKVSTAAGCADSISHPVIIYPKPTAGFVLPATYMCGIPAQVAITNTSTGAGGYYWDFGNGTYSVATNPVAVFSSSDTFTVTLVASNQFNCYDTARHPIEIYRWPVIHSIDVDPYEGCQPLEVTLTANATNANIFAWDFGDGNTSGPLTVPVTTYIYTQPGDYTITVQVLSFLDCGDTVVLTDTVKVHIKPIADFDYLVNTTLEPIDGTVIFTNESQFADSYFWDFGDGHSDINENPFHHYESVDSFSVTLYAATNFDCKDSISKSFYVAKRSLWVPNAFAPDYGGGDTLVKIWKPIGIGLRNYRAQVFNTWGELLWESSELIETQPAEGWDGTYKGTICHQDVYVWKVFGVFLDGTLWEGMRYEPQQAKKTIGSVTLIR